jgi:hypothetical protein
MLTIDDYRRHPQGEPRQIKLSSDADWLGSDLPEENQNESFVSVAQNYPEIAALQTQTQRLEIPYTIEYRKLVDTIASIIGPRKTIKLKQLNSFPMQDHDIVVLSLNWSANFKS